MSEQSAETLLKSVRSYATDLEGHLDDLHDRADGQTVGRIFMARDHLQQAIEELNEIDEENL